MIISSYIDICLAQLDSACQASNRSFPDHVEFTIHLDEKGEVCTKGELHVATARFTASRQATTRAVLQEWRPNE